jgi:hypothetical protein
VCTFCNKKKNPVDFTSKVGKILKRCQPCRDYCIKSRNKNKCEHGREYSKCKEHSNPLQITIKQMILNSKKADKKHIRYDPDNFIDKLFLETLFEEYQKKNMKCYYCDKIMKMISYECRNDIVSIERLDNKIGHIKSNCVLACFTCNCKKISDKIN